MSPALFVSTLLQLLLIVQINAVLWKTRLEKRKKNSLVGRMAGNRFHLNCVSVCWQPLKWHICGVPHCSTISVSARSRLVASIYNFKVLTFSPIANCWQLPELIRQLSQHQQQRRLCLHRVIICDESRRPAQRMNEWMNGCSLHSRLDSRKNMAACRECRLD